MRGGEDQALAGAEAQAQVGVGFLQVRAAQQATAEGGGFAETEGAVQTKGAARVLRGLERAGKAAAGAVVLQGQAGWSGLQAGRVAARRILEVGQAVRSEGGGRQGVGGGQGEQRA